MRKLKNIISFYFPPIFWCFLIFHLSSQPDLKISTGIWDLILRKIGHITEYFVLVLLVSRAFSGSIFEINKKSLIVAVLLSFLFAISDEYHQTFIHGRHGSPIDVGIDSFGVILASFFLLKIKEKNI